MKIGQNNNALCKVNSCHPLLDQVHKILHARETESHGCDTVLTVRGMAGIWSGRIYCSVEWKSQIEGATPVLMSFCDDTETS